MKRIVKVLLSRDKLIVNDSKNLCRSRCLVSVVLCFAATLMLIMNLRHNSMTMAYSSIALAVGFLISAVVAGVFRKEKIAAVIIAALVGFVLSMFAINGGNEGFAILWILLVPLFAINLLGVPAGLFLSTYFLVFLFVLFGTGARDFVVDKYSASFITRFPVLYMSDYLIATFYSLQREYYHRSLKFQAYSDGLTGAYNRRYCMERFKMLDSSKAQDFAIIVIDLNGLKLVNDSFGHEAGDETIRAVVECCQDAFEADDVICRMGGDEYVVVAYGDKDSIEKKLEKLQKNKKKWSGKLVKSVAFAVGCAYKQEDKTCSELMKIADKEMYNDKVMFYQDEKNNRRKR